MSFHRASLFACTGLAACLSLPAVPRPAPRTELTTGAGGSVAIARFEGGRTRLAIIGTTGPSIDIDADSSAIAAWADRAATRDSAWIGGVLLVGVNDQYFLEATQSARKIGK